MPQAPPVSTSAATRPPRSHLEEWGIAAMPSEVRDRFELAFKQGNGERRLFDIIWRRGKTIGVQFANARQQATAGRVYVATAENTNCGTACSERRGVRSC